MKCGKCGADNPDSADFCSLCMESLRQAGSEVPQRGSSAVPGGPYVSPSEWRGLAEEMRPSASKAVEAKVRGFRVRMAVYAAVLAAIGVMIVLSFTVWGNPPPGERSMLLIDAVNARDSDAFVGQFREKDRQAAEDLYGRVVSYLGGTGRYVGISLDTEQPNNYEAYSYLVSGSIEAGGSKREISRTDSLTIALENRGGRWYVVPSGTDILP